MGEYVETGDIGQKGQASLNLTRTLTVSCDTAETPENGWAKTWKWATSGKNGQALLDVMGTHTLPRVTAAMPKNG
jgi:hypothetical protein